MENSRITIREIPENVGRSLDLSRVSLCWNVPNFDQENCCINFAQELNDGNGNEGLLKGS